MNIKHFIKVVKPKYLKYYAYIESYYHLLNQVLYYMHFAVWYSWPLYELSIE